MHRAKFAAKVMKTAEIIRFPPFFGANDATQTHDLRVMRQSQAQIGVISAPICAFCRRSLGGFSVVSVQACPLFSNSGSKLGQTYTLLQKESLQHDLHFTYPGRESIGICGHLRSGHRSGKYPVAGRALHQAEEFLYILNQYESGRRQKCIRPLCYCVGAV